MHKRWEMQERRLVVAGHAGQLQVYDYSQAQQQLRRMILRRSGELVDAALCTQGAAQFKAGSVVCLWRAGWGDRT